MKADHREKGWGKAERGTREEEGMAVASE